MRKVSCRPSPPSLPPSSFLSILSFASDFTHQFLSFLIFFLPFLPPSPPFSPSCWAFAANALVEGQVALQQSNSSSSSSSGTATRSLSAQQFLDCDRVNLGCDGGRVGDAMAYAHDQGLRTLSSYPYTQKEGKIWLFVYLFILFIHLFIHLFIYSFIHVFIYVFMYVVIGSFTVIYLYTHTHTRRHMPGRLSSLCLCFWPHLPPSLPRRQHLAKGFVFLWAHRRECQGGLPRFHGV